MGSFTRDLRRAARSLGRTPAFTAVIVVTLTLGIGATTALFTLMDALLWRPLPVHEPGRLVYVARLDHLERSMGMGSRLVELLREGQVFEGVCGFRTAYTTVTLHGRMAPRATHAMTGDCFDTLGVRPALGRVFTQADDRPGMPKVAMLSHQTWVREYGGRPDALGETIDIAGEQFTIVGVAERRFSGLLLGFPPQALFPISQQPREAGDTRPVGVYTAYVFARLKDGQHIEQMRERLQARWPELLAASPPSQVAGGQLDSHLTSRLLVTSAATGIDYMLRERFGRPIVALVGLAVLVLLVSSVNVVSLLLARADERRSELSVRLALGAGRWRLVKEAAAECLLLISAGASLGIVLAYQGNRMLAGILGSIYEGFALNVAPDGRVLVVTLAIAVVTLVAFALVPAWRTRDMDGLALAGASVRTVGGQRAQRFFVAAQVAVALVLLVVGSFTAHLLSELRRAPLGFSTEQILTAHLTALPGGYAAGFGNHAYHHALLDRLASAPGVESVALSNMAPLFSGAYVEPVSALGAANVQVTAEQHIVTEGFFSVMQIPLIAGSPFRRADRADSPRSVIVSESLARRLFDTDDVIGRRIRVGARDDMQSLEILAVARDAVLLRPQARNTMAVYRSFWQVGPSYKQSPALLVRARGSEPAALTTAITEALRLGGREYPTYVRSLSDQRDSALAQERLVAWLSAAFAMVGLTLAAVGVYGVLRLFVGRRTREIAVRVALGATPARVQRFVLCQALGLVAAGMAVGIPIAWAARSAAARLLLHSEGSDALMPILLAVGVLIVAGTVASWLPTRRASSVDPIEALRGE